MATLNEFAYNLLNLLRGGRSTNSEIVSLEQIKFNLLYYRSLILRRDAERGINLSSFEQTVPAKIAFVDQQIQNTSGALFNQDFIVTSPSNLTVEESNLLFEGSQLTFTSESSDTSILARSARQLPDFIRLKNREAVSHIGHVYGGTRYPLVDTVQAVPFTYGRYTGSLKRAFILGNYIYLVYPTLSDEAKLSVRGIFEDPRAAHNYGVREQAILDDASVDIDDFFDDNKTPFPCSLDLYQRITQSLLSGEYSLLTPANNDTSLND